MAQAVSVADHEPSPMRDFTANEIARLFTCNGAHSCGTVADGRVRRDALIASRH